VTAAIAEDTAAATERALAEIERLVLWLAVPMVPLGVDGFGQSGTVPDRYRLHDLYPGAVVNAALAARSLDGTRA
jgi:pyruvate dehydrogenase complex dehydrogenase (E1) component